MNRLFQILIVIATVGALGCSSDDSNDEPSSEMTFDRYGVGQWDKPDDFLVRRYYTLVDTFAVKPPDISVVIKVTPGIETSVRWVIDGKNYGSIPIEEPSNTADLIIRTYLPLMDTPYNYVGGTTIAAYVKVDKNNIERRAVISEVKIERDLFGVDFGMDSLTVKEELESVHGIGRFHMRNDTIGVETISPHFLSTPNGRTLYLFEDDSLVEVAEFPGTVWEPADEEQGNMRVLSSSFLSFCHRLGFEGEIAVTSDGELIGEHEWTNDSGITFRIHMRDDVLPVESETDGDGDDLSSGAEEDTEYLPNSIGISYTKAE